MNRVVGTPEQIADRLEEWARAADREGRELGFGIRLHAISRDTAEEAWAVADRLLAGLSDEQIAKAQSIQRVSGSEGQR
jgi:alkanesulfonate monooxygenase